MVILGIIHICTALQYKPAFIENVVAKMISLPWPFMGNSDLGTQLSNNIVSKS